MSAAPTDIPFNSASSVQFHHAEEGTALLNNNISTNDSSTIKAKKSLTATWITIGVVAALCILGSAAYMTTGKVQPDMVVEHNEHAGMNQQVKSAPAVSVQAQAQASADDSTNASAADTWQNISIEKHRKEQTKDHTAKLEAYASSGEGAENRKQHGVFYADKHDGNGQTHIYPNLYKEKHEESDEPKKSAKQLARERAEREDQWIKDKALQNKRDAEAKFERTRKAEKNKAAYLEAKKNENKLEKDEEKHQFKSAKASSSTLSSPASSLVTPEPAANSLPSDVEPKQLDNEIGPNGEVYCNELDLGICLKRVLGVCVENGPCVHMPTTEPTHSPTVVPTHPTAQPTYEPTTIYNCDPWQAPCKTRGFLNICIEYEPCHSMAPSGTPTIGPTPMPSTTDDCDPLAPPCKHDFLNICYEYWPCADEGNHDSYPTGIVDIFEHNHYNHTHPHGDEPPDEKKGEEDDETEESEGGETASTEESEEQKETSGSVDKKGKSDEPCEDKKESEDTQTPIEGTPNLK
jgi:hypothetical protein